MSNLIDSVRSYILTCPFLSDGRVNVDYIGTDMEYSVDPLPCDPIMQRYMDGGQRSSSSLRLRAKRNTIRTQESISKTVDFSRASKSGWNSRVSMTTSQNSKKRRTQYQSKL